MKTAPDWIGPRYSLPREQNREETAPFRRPEAGFSLKELLVVVAVIGILAAMAIPNFLESKKAANEAVALTYVRTWTSAQEIFKSKHGRYAGSNDELVQEELVPPVRDQHGYVFELHGTENFWWGTAQPAIPGRSGGRAFYLDLSGVLRSSEALDNSAGGAAAAGGSMVSNPCRSFGLDPASPACP